MGRSCWGSKNYRLDSCKRFLVTSMTLQHVHKMQFPSAENYLANTGASWVCLNRGYPQILESKKVSSCTVSSNIQWVIVQNAAIFHGGYSIGVQFHGEHVQKPWNIMKLWNGGCGIQAGLSNETTADVPPIKLTYRFISRKQSVTVKCITQPGWWLTYPSEKYEFISWDDDIPNLWKNKTCSKPPAT